MAKRIIDTDEMTDDCGAVAPKRHEASVTTVGETSVRKRILEEDNDETMTDGNGDGPQPKRAHEAPHVSSIPDGVVLRVARWILSRSNGEQSHPLSSASHVPKTRERLEHAIAPLCRMTVAVDPRVVLFHLLVNGVVVATTTDGVGTPSAETKYTANRSLDIASLRAKGFLACCPGETPEGTSERFSEEFVCAFWKAATWVLSNRGLPETMAPLLRCMEQVCTIRRDVSPSVVAEELSRRDWVSFFACDGCVPGAAAVDPVVVYHVSRIAADVNNVMHFEGSPIADPAMSTCEF